MVQFVEEGYFLNGGPTALAPEGGETAVRTVHAMPLRPSEAGGAVRPLF